MKKRNQVRRNGSSAAAAPQSKSAYTKARAGHQPTANGDAPSGFCLFDGAVGMEVCKLPLVRAQMVSVVKAVMIRGISTDQFISEAISEKLTRTSARSEAVSPSGAVTVLLFDRDKDEEIEQFDLTNAEFSRIRDAIAKTVDRPVDREAVTNFVRESLVHPSALTSGPILIAVQVLVDLAVRKVQDCPIDEQICVWNALSKTLPDSAARELARNIALLQSKVAALHLQFADTLSSQAAAA